MTSLKHPPLSVRAAAKYLGLPSNSVYRAVSRGELPHMRIGRRILISAAVLDRLLGEGREDSDGNAGHV